LGGEQGQGDGDGAGRDHHFSAVVHARSSARREEALSAALRCAGKRAPAVTAKVAPGAGQAIAANLFGSGRKVRAPVDKVPGNAWGARAHGKCNRKQTAEVPQGAGKGERVR